MYSGSSNNAKKLSETSAWWGRFVEGNRLILLGIFGTAFGRIVLHHLNLRANEDLDRWHIDVSQGRVSVLTEASLFFTKVSV